MPVSDRHRDLIQKYYEALATEAELAELEGLLAADPEVAAAFAETARLHAALQSHFRKQYKIDQVAALLDASGSTSSSPTGIPSANSGAVPVKSRETESMPAHESAFIPIDSRLIKPRRDRSWPRSDRLPHLWKWTAAAALLLLLGMGVWTFRDSFGERPRIVSGQVTVAGREVTELPDQAMFNVGGKGATIELPGGVRIELLATTSATIRRQSGRYVVQLATGGGQFHVAQRPEPAFDIKTVLGVVSTTGGRFSLDLVTTLPEQITPTERLRLPTLAVVVADGSVTVKHAGILTTLAAGEQHIFFNPT